MIEHDMRPLRLNWDTVPVDARLTLTWLQQEFSLGCVIRGPGGREGSFLEFVYGFFRLR